MCRSGRGRHLARERGLRHLHSVSALILILGIVIAGLGIVLDLSAVVILIGMMLIVAGIVKIITVRIWHGFFDGDTAVGK